MKTDKILLTLCLALGTSMTLSACMSTSPVATRVEIQTVNVPVPVDCKIDVPDRPNWNFPNLETSDSLFEKVKSLLADREMSHEYQRGLEKSLSLCRGESSAD